MILVAGSILATAETLEEIKRLALVHMRCSRTEDGYLHHSVHVDVENPLRLVFVVRWRDQAAMLKHFADRDARGFVKTVPSLAAKPMKMAIYESAEFDVGSLSV